MDKQIFKVDKEKLFPDDNQPRKYFSQDAVYKKLQQLENSGQKSPITVYPPDEQGRYKIHDGELRYRAACMSDTINTLDAVLYSCDSGGIESLVSQLLHNDDGSEPLSVLERAKAYEKIIVDFVEQGSDKPSSDAAALLGMDLGEFSRIHSISDLPGIIEEFALKYGIDDSRVLNGMKYIFKVGKDKALADLFFAIEQNYENKKSGQGRSVRAIVKDAKDALKSKVARRKPTKSAAEKKQRLLTAQNISIKSEASGDVLLIETPRERIKIRITADILEQLQNGQLLQNEPQNA